MNIYFLVYKNVRVHDIFTINDFVCSPFLNNGCDEDILHIFKKCGWSFDKNDHIIPGGVVDMIFQEPAAWHIYGM